MPLVSELDRPAIEVETPVRAETLLRSISRLRPDGSPESIKYPDIPLLDTTLLTNSPGETALGHQILTEIDSADRIDLVMAFIRRSGTRPFVEALRKHCADGRPLRILTTTYTGSTEGSALQELAGPRSRGSRLLRHRLHTTAREGLGLWSRHRLLNGIRRFLEPDSYRSSQRTGVECPCFRGTEPRCGRQDPSGICLVLGKQGLRSIRLGRL